MSVADACSPPGPPSSPPGPPSSPPPSPTARSEGSFQTEGRGIVGSSGPGFYVVRGADSELLERLEQHEPCHVLAPRQIGKSSLRVRTQERLRARGIRCASVDLTSIGSGASADEWYFSVASAVAEELGLPDDLDTFWGRHRRMSPVRRFRQFLYDVLLGDAGSPAVVFIDEIDVTMSLPFSRDDFFGLIRATHQERAVDPRWNRLSFCLIGVAAPLDLVADPERTPFNTSCAVRIDDFTRAEARTFLPGLAGAADTGERPEALLDAVIAWTGGHPALTQRLCYWLTRAAANERALPADERVSALVRRLFLSSGRIDDPILLDAERRFAGDRADARIPVMLHLYQRLLDGEPVPVDGNNPRQFGLRIAGLAAERREGDATLLRVRNRIFAEVFNRAWVEEKLARRFLTEPLQIWKDSGKKDDHVLRGGALEIALAWARGREDVTPDERDFLQGSQAVSSHEQQERQQAEIDRTQRDRAEQQVRLQRRVVSLLAGSVVLVALSLVIAIFQYQRAQQALEQENTLRTKEVRVNEMVQRTNEARTKQLDRDRWAAEQAFDEATKNLEAATATARILQAEVDAANMAAEDARKASRSTGSTSSTSSTSVTRRVQQLMADAKQKTDDLDAQQRRVEVAEAALREARSKLTQVNHDADPLKAAGALTGSAAVPTDPVLGSVQSTLMAERALAEKLQEDLRRKTAEADKAKEEIELMKELVAKLQESEDQLRPRERVGAGSRELMPQRSAASAGPVQDAGVGTGGSP